MARQRFKMHHYRQAPLRMCQGQSDRDIAAARLMGRRKAADWRALAKARDWLDPQTPMPMARAAFKLRAIRNWPVRQGPTMYCLDVARPPERWDPGGQQVTRRYHLLFRPAVVCSDHTFLLLFPNPD